MENLRYPIGKFIALTQIGTGQRGVWLTDIEQLPSLLRQAVAGLDEAQLDTPYRLGGWTARQVVHHLADSHLNAFIRLKWALTEEAPVIKAYFEDRWAEHADSRQLSVEVSLAILEPLHQRWAYLLRSLTEPDFARGFVHPEHGRLIRIDQQMGMYAWHGRHHTAHLTALRSRAGW